MQAIIKSFLIAIGSQLYGAFSAIQSESTAEGAVAKMTEVLNSLMETQKIQSLTAKQVLLTMASEYYKPFYQLQDFIDEFWTKFVSSTQFTGKVLTWVGGTLVPVSFCAVFTPGVYTWLFNTARSTWNGFCSSITNAFGADVTLYGIPLKPI